MDIKEMYIDALEEIIAETLDNNPGMSWEAAYDRASDAAYDRMRDRMADIGDAARKRRADR